MGEILALCRAMGAEEEQEQLLRSLIRAVIPSLEGRLKPGCTRQQCGAAFPLAVAMMVMDGLSDAGGMGQVTSFSAGDVSIRRGGVDGTSRSQQAERLLAPWMESWGLAFKGVEG